MKYIQQIALVAGLSVLGGMATAEGAFDGAIKARQSLMRLNAFTIGQMAAMAKGEVPYDAAAAQGLADNMMALTTLDTMAMWPAGSDNGANEGTKALPAIWADGSDILTKVGAWVDASKAMQVAAGTDLAAMQGAMDGLGGACGGCHKAFRASN